MTNAHCIDLAGNAFPATCYAAALVGLLVELPSYAYDALATGSDAEDDLTPFTWDTIFMLRVYCLPSV